ncbi:helix-turn-helix transcriptional regulator [Bacteroides caccae]|jgi:transcriptional regulator with XRE-family HTH domain|uniref:helix-turn-helix domain-containing protein n=1 Tax=Bacteroides caccae TaxID=47678 RepID=UPI00216698A5|nr:helix-turn-helix transcriptional regulator [Bacteroides caccae]MCS2366470.1 helix-turn-helix transcriptional regulator [Bacteroides caccae]MCS3190907.1 helix-turn-helix transcriptional regulator [Bacteroides caccae]
MNKEELMKFKPESEMTLREIVISRRKKAGLTQIELAEKSGITQAQLSNFESGKATLNSDSLDKLFAVLKMKSAQSAEAQWDLAGLCAERLKERGIKDVSLITREEMSKIAENEEILLLQIINDKLYDMYASSGIINEHNTYNYFQTIVAFRLACLK